LAIIIDVGAFGGSERHTVDFVQHLVRAGWRVALIETGLDLVSSRLGDRPANLEVIRTNLPLKDISRRAESAWRRLLRRVPARAALLVKTWYFAADLPCLRAIRRAYPLVYHIEHSLPPERPPRTSRLHFGFLPGLGLWWYRDLWQRWRMSRLVDHVVSVSAAGSRALVEHALLRPERISTCPNGVDTTRWTRDVPAGQDFRLRYGIPRGAYLCGVVGRLVPLKSIDLAIRAVALLNREGPEPLELCIVGAGPCRDELEQLARQLGITERVHFTGALVDVKPAYSAIDTLLCTSQTESCSLVLSEALACGCRVVAAAVGGVPEVLGAPICGTLLESRAPCDWADAVRRQMQTPWAEQLDIARGIRAYAVRAHAQQTRFAELETLLRQGILTASHTP
jgi:glycosyltransferase involved in cell wall biosynthesis